MCAPYSQKESSKAWLKTSLVKHEPAATFRLPTRGSASSLHQLCSVRLGLQFNRLCRRTWHTAGSILVLHALCVVRPGAQRGIMMLQGRSRLAIYADRTWPQLLQWRRDLEHATLRTELPGCRGQGKSPRVDQPLWLAEYPRARGAVICSAQRRPLEVEDVQFLMCELSKRASSVLLGRPRST